MVTEQLSVEDGPELRTENVLRIAAEDRERIADWCRENLTGNWQVVRRHFTSDDEEAIKTTAQSERVREVRFTRGEEPVTYRFEIWELRIDDAEEAASAKLALT